MDRFPPVPRDQHLHPGQARLNPSPAAPDPASFRSACSVLGIDLTPAQLRQLQCYATLLREWNTRINLISRRDVDRIFSYHIVDSIAASQLIPSSARCCDIGTGAGLPGIPLAIVRPDIQMVLVDSTRKKCRFLRLAVGELRLGNVDIVCARSESLDSLACEVVLSRLTGQLRTTLRNIMRHAKPGGSIILYKNPAAVDESAGSLPAKLGLVRNRAIDMVLPLSSIPRRLVVLSRP